MTPTDADTARVPSTAHRRSNQHRPILGEDRQTNAADLPGAQPDVRIPPTEAYERTDDDNSRWTDDGGQTDERREAAR